MGFKDLDPQGTLAAGMKALGWEKDSDPDYLILDYPSKVQTGQAQLKEINTFIVPTGVSFNSLHATGQTIDFLESMRVSPSKVSILPNRIRHGSTHESGLKELNKYKKEGYLVPKPIPLRMEIEQLVDRGFVFSPQIREIISMTLMATLSR